ncbi:enoyl-CoA hydratase/carnithine racemase [Antricoccus suffuscus]|uniref:Enoyl-CoA hydratase/carnithine racemase n=1 Tax=Antricoccus suffuscus TaxID=1629062 RepID=A0A2T0ZTL2_9ACTN|nr:enoyl-CoA hydratase-related protein [Antricoccus suffuscus]PRZ39692.1 enoyl-CoA hydratase/carnithine racemase [Antricoccus suffuscus]
MTDYETILYDVDDPIATITLNRPERLNAWTMTMSRELGHALTSAGNDRRVVGVIVTGTGRAFCSGGDLKDLTLDDLRVPKPAAPASAHESLATNAETAGPFALMRNLDKPVIAAVNGPAVGMGAVIALWADLRFMSQEAMFTMAFSQRGTVAEGASSWLLSRLIGPGAAFDVLISSRRVQPDEAFRLGWVDRVLPAGELLTAAREYLQTLLLCSPTSMATIKKQIYADLSGTLTNSARASSSLLAACVDSGDIQEGWQSFLEKRAPQYARLGTE